MGIENATLYGFNRGIISKWGLARVDVKRSALSAEIQENWMPKVLGSMMLRPGLAYTGSTYNNQQAVHLPFIFSLTDTAIIELTNQSMRVKVGEQPITRVSVGTTITNGTFSGSLTGWNQEDQAGATSAWASGNIMSLIGTGANRAIRTQQITVASGDQGKEHALRIVVNRGHVILRVGTSDGEDSYINETILDPGTHSLALTPTGNFWISLAATTTYATYVEQCTIEAAGTMTLPTPWLQADLELIRSDQSADVLFLACDSTTIAGGYAQYKIERRGVHSWSVVQYLSEDGPFNIINTSATTIAASALSGDITLTASQPLFYQTQVGALLRITSIDQTTSDVVGGNGQYGNYIRVTGLSNRNPGDPSNSQRVFTINIGGSWAGTIVLQQSVGSPGTWIDVASYTGNQSISYDDGLDNQIIYYRLGFETGYTSGSATVGMVYAQGEISGVVRITGFTDNQHVSASVITPLGNTLATSTWYQGMWSTYSGFPTSVLLYEGRLWWMGRDYMWGSVSDAYASYDPTTVGDSGPIIKSIGSGPLDSINWAIPLQAMVMGGQFGEHFLLSNTLQEPLTPTNNNIKTYSTQGSAPVPALKKDLECIFLQRSGQRVFTVSFNPIYLVSNIDELTTYCPEVTGYGTPPSSPTTVVRMAIQRQPDTRIHCVLSDGTVAVLIYDKLENVQAWVKVTTPNGFVEDVLVMPDISEESVYYSVKRTINGSTVRYLERWALESECIGGTLSKNIDSHIVFQNSGSVTTVTAPSLAGQTVAIWADGVAQTSVTADSSGNITLAGGATATNWVVGIPYQSKFKSAKLAYAAQAGTALTQKKKVGHLGVILENTHYQGLMYGVDMDNLFNLPLVEYGAVTANNTIWGELDSEPFEFEGEYNTDSRLWLVGNSPYPVTVLAAVMTVETNEKV